jgi:hypothetical protein
MLGLLDRATKLTSSQGENREYLDPRLKAQALLAGAIGFIGASDFPLPAMLSDVRGESN